MYNIVIQWLMGQKQMISTTLVDVLSSLKEIVIFLRQKNTQWYLKKTFNMQISAIFFLSSCTDFTQMYFDIGDLCVKRLEPLSICV